jgi:hypothetical protein
VKKGCPRVLDSYGWLDATEGGLVAAGGMRLYPLAGHPLGFDYLFASHPHIRAGLVSGGHATVPVTLAGITHPH